MKQKTHSLTALAACHFKLASDSTDTPVQLFPAGKFNAPDGALKGSGTWTLNADNAKRLIGALSDQQNILIDYDHQSLLFTKNKAPLAAAGTFSGAGLEWREGKGLFATGIQWTAAAAEKIKSGSYQYISPLFTYDQKTGAVQNLISIAVTDNPAIKNMAAIELAAASLLTQPTEDTMIKKLIPLLGLSATADEAAVLAACSALKDKTALSPDLIAALSLDDKAKPDDVLAAVKKLQADKDALAATSEQLPDAKKYVPIHVVTELQTQLAALSKDVETDKINQLIEANASKLPTPGLKQWAKTQGIAALTAYLKEAPEIAALSTMQTEGNQPPDGVGDSQTIIAAASKYQHEQSQLGNEISVADAVSHVTQTGAK